MAYHNELSLLDPHQPPVPGVKRTAIVVVPRLNQVKQSIHPRLTCQAIPSDTIVTIKWSVDRMHRASLNRSLIPVACVIRFVVWRLLLCRQQPAWKLGTSAIGSILGTVRRPFSLIRCDILRMTYMTRITTMARPIITCQPELLRCPQTRSNWLRTPPAERWLTRPPPHPQSEESEGTTSTAKTVCTRLNCWSPNWRR